MLMQVPANIAAVWVASCVIMTGMGMLDDGWVGALDRFSGWIAGNLIFLFLAVASLPIGLVLRATAGRVFRSPFLGALAVGSCAGLALIPVLHPAMMPPLSFATHPIALLAIHGIAGLIGGWIWYQIERPAPRGHHA